MSAFELILVLSHWVILMLMQIPYQVCFSKEDRYFISSNEDNDDIHMLLLL